MSVFKEAVKYLDEVRSLPDIFKQAEAKRRVLKVGDYILTGFGCGKIGFRLEREIEWTHQRCQTLEGIAAEYGLNVVYGLYVHLKDASGREIASVQDISFENSIYVGRDYERAEELLEELGSKLFGASGEGTRVS
jgi:hypothetical protein